MKTKRFIWAALFAAVLMGASSCEDEPLNADAFYMSLSNESVNGGKGVISGEPMAVTLNVNQEFSVLSFRIPVLDDSTPENKEAIGKIITVDPTAYEDKGKGNSHKTYSPQEGNKYTFSFSDGSLVLVDKSRYKNGETIKMEIEVQSMVTGTKKKATAAFEVFYGNEMSISVLNPHPEVQTTAATRQIDGKPVPLLFSGDPFVLKVKGTSGDRFRFVNATTGVAELDAADTGNLIHSSSAEYTLGKDGYREITIENYVTNELCFGQDGCRIAKLRIKNLTTERETKDIELPFYTAPEFKPAVSVVDGTVKGGQPMMLKLEYPFEVDTLATGNNPVISVSSMKILGWNEKRFNETESDNNDIELSRLFPDGFTWYYSGENQDNKNRTLTSIQVRQTREPVTIKSQGNAIVTRENSGFTLQVVVEDKVYTGQSRTVTCQFDSKYPAAQTDFRVTALAGNFENVPYYAPEANSEGRTELENITVSSASSGIALRIDGETGGGSDKYGYVWKPKNPEIAIDGNKTETANNLVKGKNIALNTSDAFEKGVYYLTIFSCDPQGKPYLTSTGEYVGFKTIAVRVIPTIELYAEAVTGYKWYDGTNAVHFDKNAYAKENDKSKRYPERNLNENERRSEWARWPQDVYVVAKYKSSKTDSFTDEIPVDIKIKVKLERISEPNKSYSYYGLQKEICGNVNHDRDYSTQISNNFNYGYPDGFPPEGRNEKLAISKANSNTSLSSVMLKTLQDWDSDATLVWRSLDKVYRVNSDHGNTTNFKLSFSTNIEYKPTELYIATDSFINNINDKGWFYFELSSDF